MRHPKPNFPGPGRYRHYKGSEYEALGLAFDAANGQVLVIYEPKTPGSKLDGTPVRFWARPLADFTAVLDCGTQRFELTGPSHAPGFVDGLALHESQLYRLKVTGPRDPDKHGCTLGARRVA